MTNLPVLTNCGWAYRQAGRQAYMESGKGRSGEGVNDGRGSFIKGRDAEAHRQRELHMYGTHIGIKRDRWMGSGRIEQFYGFMTRRKLFAL